MKYTLFGLDTPQGIIEAAALAYDAIFEAKGNPLHRAMKHALAQALGLTGNDQESAALLVKNTRDAVNTYLWKRDDGEVDCRKPFAKFYKFLLPIMKQKFGADTENYNVTAASDFMRSLDSMQDKISADPITGNLTASGTEDCITFDYIKGAEKPNRRLRYPADSDLPATPGKYTVTYIDSAKTLLDMDLYQYTHWCICDPIDNRGENQFNSSYNGVYGSNTCYLISRDKFESIPRESPDYATSLICLFVGPAGELKFAFNRNNDMISGNTISTVLGYDFTDDCYPRFSSFTPENLCDKLSALEYVDGSVNPEEILRNSDFACEYVYSSGTDLYGVEQYYIDSEKYGRNVLFRFNTGRNSPSNYRLLSKKWDINELGTFPNSAGAIAADGVIYNNYGEKIYEASYGLYNGWDASISGILLAMNKNWHIGNLVFLDDGSTVFDKDIDIAHISTRYPPNNYGDLPYIKLANRVPIDLQSIGTNDHIHINVDKMPNPVKIPEGYDTCEILDAFWLSVPLTQVSKRRSDGEYIINFVWNDGSLLLDKEYVVLDEQNIDKNGILYLTLSNENTATRTYKTDKYKINLNTQTIIDFVEGPVEKF